MLYISTIIINDNLDIFVKLNDSNIGGSLHDTTTSNNDNIKRRLDYYETHIFSILLTIGVNKGARNAPSTRIIGVHGDAFLRVRKDSGSVQDCKIQNKIANVTDNSTLCHRKLMI